MITLIVLAVVVVFLVGVFLWGTGIYNSLVGLDEGVSSAWSQVEVNISVAWIIKPRCHCTGICLTGKGSPPWRHEARAKVQLTVTKMFWMTESFQNSGCTG
jgi:hypothetical protein